MSVDPRGLIAKAEKTLQSASGGFSFFSSGKEDKLQSAAELFVEAGNAFKLERMNTEAGKAFEKAADIHRNKLNEPDDAANLMVDAFKVYRKDSPEDAVRCVEQAINHYTSKGNFRRAASHKETEGEVLEMEIGDLKRALDCYEKAATWYEGDNATALANKLWLKVADISALDDDFYRAVENFEKVAEQSLNNNLMRYSVKEYFLKAGLCMLATKDVITTRRNLERYAEKDPSFAGQREYQLLSDLVDAVEAGNQEAYTDKLFAYDQMSRLDKWKTAICVKIKNQIEEADNEFS
ncbi:soluble NSF attachment protein [Lasiosphaeria miniovina]|uniref:Soluble NSF attachment protein n=2 Tax=Lasiosphaeria TaxID=92901 RepID=A0AA39ZZX1_9PEZI|nr:soluble NSF attachment protein [Lasiosphaeria miniovina]KAK0706707.1 soluble NSF attachment protein [Lasiosphaeria miniovina]KAK3371542.1 soluble NSF attachment protein [Lasiosphaeria ovina]